MDWPGTDEFTPEFFNNSSKAWMANKLRLGVGVAYRCTYVHSNKKLCSKAVVKHDLCKKHLIFKKKSVQSLDKKEFKH